MGRVVYYDWQGNEIEPPKADPVPVTNADRIRAMTDEELARWISEITYCGACKDLHGFKLCDFAPSWNCEKSYLDWLKQEATE